MDDLKKIEFIASLPPILSAISLDGLGDGCRIKLDVSRQYIQAILKLQELAGTSFRVTIEGDNKWLKWEDPK